MLLEDVEIHLNFSMIKISYLIHSAFTRTNTNITHTWTAWWLDTGDTHSLTHTHSTWREHKYIHIFKSRESRIITIRKISDNNHNVNIVEHTENVYTASPIPISISHAILLSIANDLVLNKNSLEQSISMLPIVLCVWYWVFWAQSECHFSCVLCSRSENEWIKTKTKNEKRKRKSEIEEK